MSEERVKSGPVQMSDQQGHPLSAESSDGQKEKRPYKPGPIFKLAVSLCAACAAAAGLLMLLAWVSFRMRFSADVVRAGIMGVYALPCLIGGRIVKGFRLRPTPLWGAGLGAAYYGVLLVISWLMAGSLQETKVGLTVPIVCVASGLLGSLMGRRGRQ